MFTNDTANLLGQQQHKSTVLIVSDWPLLRQHRTSWILINSK